MTNQEYHAAEGLSSSDFRLLAESPLHLVKKNLFKLESKNLTVGSALHKLVLEPKEFNDEFIVEEEFNKRTKQGKEDYEKWCQSVEDKSILTKSEFEKITKMALNVKEIAGGLLCNGEAEKSVFIKDSNGITRKCRPDYYIESLGIVIDVKTTKDGDSFSFAKSLYEYNYYLQGAWYLDTLELAGFNAKRFIFITVESNSPHMVRVNEISEDALELGRKKYQKLYDEYLEYLKTNRCNVVKEIDLPSWVYEKSA